MKTQSYITKLQNRHRVRFKADKDYSYIANIPVELLKSDIEFVKNICMASLVAGLFGICESSNGTAKIKTLNVKKSFSVKMKVGETIRIKPKKAQTDTIKFRSDNKKVATVNSKGYIKAKKTGNAKIIAKNTKIQIVGKIKVVKNNCTQSEGTSSNAISTGIPQASPNNDIGDNLSTLKPSGSPEATASPVPSEIPEQEPSRDIWLSIHLDQKEIYTNTTHLSGGGMLSANNCILIISCKEEVIKTITLKDYSTFEFDIDFSGYKAGDDVCIALKYVGERSPHLGVWGDNQELHYVLQDPGQTPASGTPEPSQSPESTYEPRI